MSFRPQTSEIFKVLYISLRANLFEIRAVYNGKLISILSSILYHEALLLRGFVYQLNFVSCWYHEALLRGLVYQLNFFSCWYHVALLAYFRQLISNATSRGGSSRLKCRSDLIWILGFRLGSADNRIHL